MDGDGDLIDGTGDNGTVMCPNCSTDQPATQTICANCSAPLPASVSPRKKKKRLTEVLEAKAARAVVIEESLRAVVATRVAAAQSHDSAAFVAAFAHERLLREQLAEARTPTSYFFEPDLHPRDRLGEFVNVLAKLKVGGSASVPGGIEVFRKQGHFKVVGRGGSNLGRTRNAKTAAAAALSAHEASGATVKLTTPPVFRVESGILRGRGYWRRPEFQS